MGKEYVPEILSVRTATWLIPSTPNTPRNKGRRRKPKPIFPQRSTQTKRWEHGSIWTKRGRGYYVVARSYYMLVKSCLLGLVLPFKTALIWKNKIIIFNTHFSWAFTLNQSKAIEYIYTVHIIWNLQFCMFFWIFFFAESCICFASSMACQPQGELLQPLKAAEIQFSPSVLWTKSDSSLNFWLFSFSPSSPLINTNQQLKRFNIWHFYPTFGAR